MLGARWRLWSLVGGVRRTPEQCDDGNPNDADGCSGACVPEAGFLCTDIELEDRVLSQCAPQCGDGIVVGSEVCDDGVGNDNSSYGGCRTDCSLGPCCGDGKLDEGQEQCDDGVGNVVVYYAADEDGDEPGCTPGCTLSPHCGDWIVDQEFGEECDNGPGTIVGACLSCLMYAGP